ncbi:DUF3122 domain-containing protein [Cyanobacterium stanieri]|nr:DUF3122 domain-containing protein [Cyanobacterium stanieri]
MPLPAIATVTQIEEAPGQMVYQSRQKFQDLTGNYWSAIAFKRTTPENITTISLRIIAFPDIANLDHNQPLTLTTSLGKTLKAENITNNISQKTPPANVSEYNLKPILPQLRAEIPLQLTISTTNGDTINLSIPPAVIREWQSL